MSYYRVGRLRMEFGILQHRDLGDAGERPRLAPREILEPPEVCDGFHRQHGRGIVTLFLDKLADLRRSPGRELRHGWDDGLHERVGFGLVLRLRLGRFVPPVTLL